MQESSSLVSDVRSPLHFAIEGLSIREELLFKSLVRLLNNRLRHDWVYSTQNASLLVVAQATKLPLSALRRNMAQRILTVGVGGNSREGFLATPFRHEEIETELNRQGDTIVHLRAAAPVSLKLGYRDVQIRLLRWPTTLLNGRQDYTRLAALMTGRAVSLAFLVERTGFDELLCCQFLDALMHENLLVKVDSAVDRIEPNRISVSDLSEGANTLKKAAELGLFARIRKILKR